MDDESRYAQGIAVRREVLGDGYVDRALGNRDGFTAEFQDLLTRYAWGEIWTRPGLSHHSRRVLVIGTMIALGRWEEFRMHVRPALESGEFPLSDLKEVILQQAIYCGVPAANNAFRHLGEILAELEAKGVRLE